MPADENSVSIWQHIGIRRSYTVAEKCKTCEEQLADALDRLRALQSRLMQQERAAEIGRLTGGIAHELNNPLSYVTGNFSILHDTLLSVENTLSPAELKDILDDIDGGLRHLREIVTGMRKISRPDKVGFSEYDLNDAIKTTLVAAHYELKYAAVVEQELGSLPIIEANEGQLGQVLLSLILRAVHAIRSKGGKFFGTIRIRTFSDAEHVVCEIEDNGRGLSEEEMGRLFELFPLAEEGAAAWPGLGLAYDIVVNRHHGELVVQSAPESGNKFVIRLPVTQGQAQE